MSDGFLGIGNEGQLATWLVASFLLYTLAAQITWQYRYPGREDALGRWIDRVRHQPLLPWLGEVVRLVYFLGIPFLVTISGLLRADLLGLSGTDWDARGESAGLQGFLWEDWAWGLGLAATAVLGMWGVWLIGRALARRADLEPTTFERGDPAWQRLLGVLYDQIHWAFYRSGFLLWLDDRYWGVFAGLALLLLEAGLNPAHLWAFRNPRSAGPLLIRLGMAWISALLFLATRNLWITAAAHLALVGLVGWTTSDRLQYADDAPH